MLTSHELFGFMSPALAVRIIECAHDDSKELYRKALEAVAEARKLRPAFLERSPRATRHKDMAAIMARPRLELVAANLLREWLMKKKTAMLAQFLDSLGIAHQGGAVDDLPASVEDAKLTAAVEALLASNPAEEVAVYLNAFYTMNEVQWPNLESMLKTEPRLQFGG
jgi:rhamnose utilization protein RhaD (predicted bifunctional aldolase and dehydrogenase)